MNFVKSIQILYVQKLIRAVYENVVYKIITHEGHLSKNTVSAVRVQYVRRYE
jgi:hypothetical protein